jgi:hypothetical protein
MGELKRLKLNLKSGKGRFSDEEIAKLRPFDRAIAEMLVRTSELLSNNLKRELRSWKLEWRSLKRSLKA